MQMDSAAAAASNRSRLQTDSQAGLPDQLRSGIESLSGMNLDHVRVVYNSPIPAQYNALAYAIGNEIHVAPGQQHHLPHEAWHVVQQQQGRVSATNRTHIGLSQDPDILRIERELLARRTPI